MKNSTRRCRRSDEMLSDVIENGIFLQHLAGDKAAWRFLLSKGIAPETIERVLGPSNQLRRPWRIGRASNGGSPS